MKIGDSIFVEYKNNDDREEAVYGTVVAFDDVFAEVRLSCGRLALVKYGKDEPKSRR